MNRSCTEKETHLIICFLGRKWHQQSGTCLPHVPDFPVVLRPSSVFFGNLLNCTTSWQALYFENEISGWFLVNSPTPRNRPFRNYKSPELQSAEDKAMWEEHFVLFPTGGRCLLWWKGNLAPFRRFSGLPQESVAWAAVQLSTT